MGEKWVVMWINDLMGFNGWERGINGAPEILWEMNIWRREMGNGFNG